MAIPEYDRIETTVATAQPEPAAPHPESVMKDLVAAREQAGHAREFHRKQIQRHQEAITRCDEVIGMVTRALGEENAVDTPNESVAQRYLG